MKRSYRERDTSGYQHIGASAQAVTKALRSMSG
jgi:hypothetical protein